MSTWLFVTLDRQPNLTEIIILDYNMRTALCIWKHSGANKISVIALLEEMEMNVPEILYLSTEMHNHGPLNVQKEVVVVMI